MLRGIPGLIIIGAILTVALMVNGCSGANTLLDPAVDEQALTPREGTEGGTMLWGAWDVTIDTETEAVEITELRTANGSLNVLGFLEPPALSNMSIANLQLLPAQNRVTVDVSLTHPFLASGKFTGFDVKGVVFGPDLLNADGYTLWMNPGDFKNVGFGYIDGLLGAPDSTANYGSRDWGYKYFADGLTKNASLTTFFSNNTNLNNRGKFTEGTTNTRFYDLDFQTPSKFLTFNYAMVANYDWPSGGAPYNVVAFPIATANSREAFCLDAYVISNNLWYDSMFAIGGGFLNLDVEVWDWQGLGNTSVTLNIPSMSPIIQASYTAGSTSYSGIFSFPNVTIAPTSANPINITIVATDSSATFGSSWFAGLLPASNPQYATNVYTVIKQQIPVAAAGAYYTTKSVNDFVLWPYPHQSSGINWDFVDYYDFTSPPVHGRHDICVIPGPGTVKVIDTMGYGVGGAPPPGGGIIYDIPLPLGSAPEIPAPYMAGALPQLFPPWMPTRFDSNSFGFETHFCTGSTNTYLFSPPWPPQAPEYSIIQVYHVPPGAGGPPYLLDIDPTVMLSTPPWFIGVDVSNGFYNANTTINGAGYGLFFFDYATWFNCGYIGGPPVGSPGVAMVYELNNPVNPATITGIALPTSFGVSGGGGPGVIDDSSAWGVCGSLAIDNQPGNQPGLMLTNSTMVYVLDTFNEIKIYEVDFTTGMFVNYSELTKSFMGAGMMAADIETIDCNKLAGTNPLGYVPGTNLLAVAMVDGSIGPSQGHWRLDIYIINPGQDTATLFASSPKNSGQPFLAMDVDETTGEIYVLHGSNSIQASTAISVYKFV